MSSPDCVFRLDVIRCMHPTVSGATDDARCGACEHRAIPHKPRGIVSKAASYITAEASLALHGPVPEDVSASRSALCMACPKRVSGDGADAVGYCNSCGCGTWSRARLSVKVTMPAAFCPLGLWKRHEPPPTAPEPRECPAKPSEPLDLPSTYPDAPPPQAGA